MKRLALSVCLPLFALGPVACAKTSHCDELAQRVCERSTAHCVEARGWIDGQGAGEPAARDAACAQVLASPGALAAYGDRFAAEMAPRPVATPSRSPATPAAPAARPATKPPAKSDVEKIGETIEEIGNTGEKAGEAIDKIDDAFRRKDAN